MAEKTTAGTAAVIERIAQLRAFQTVASRLHEVIMEAAPELQPRLWYGMPGYAKSRSGPVICFFRVDDDQFVTFGLTEKANLELDEDAAAQLRASAWFLTDPDEPTESRIATIVTKAVT